MLLAPCLIRASLTIVCIYFANDISAPGLECLTTVLHEHMSFISFVSSISMFYSCNLNFIFIVHTCSYTSTFCACMLLSTIAIVQYCIYINISNIYFNSIQNCHMNYTWLKPWIIVQSIKAIMCPDMYTVNPMKYAHSVLHIGLVVAIFSMSQCDSIF